jgi:hypothetical protein
MATETNHQNLFWVFNLPSFPVAALPVAPGFELSPNHRFKPLKISPDNSRATISWRLA